MNTKPYRSHEDATVESLARDPEYAAEYLNVVLEDGDQAEVLLALRRLARAFGGVGAVAEQAELNSASLYRALSEKGNPELSTLIRVLRAMNLRLAVQARTVEAHVEELSFRVVPLSIGSHLPETTFGPFRIETVETRLPVPVPDKFFARTAGAGVKRQDECPA